VCRRDGHHQQHHVVVLRRVAWVGEPIELALQLIIGYDPQPTYDSGSLEKADPETQQRATEFSREAWSKPSRARPNAT
jgi:hypothetical protein